MNRESHTYVMCCNQAMRIFIDLQRSFLVLCKAASRIKPLYAALALELHKSNPDEAIHNLRGHERGPDRHEFSKALACCAFE